MKNLTQMVAKRNKKITFNLNENISLIQNPKLKPALKINLQEEKYLIINWYIILHLIKKRFKGVIISLNPNDKESIILVIMHYLYNSEELKTYFQNEIFSDFDNILLKEIKVITAYFIKKT